MKITAITFALLALIGLTSAGWWDVDKIIPEIGNLDIK